jgi:hypothetical protein
VRHVIDDRTNPSGLERISALDVDALLVALDQVLAWSTALSAIGAE